ncbi:uncharacterized protein Mst57Da [Maniola hyperantus]|uniref:uncharacterized protein Mst57Da n=1 Tax=Aphantopus hyperantus TaxID=2795564 RepID=UPI002127013A
MFSSAHSSSTGSDASELSDSSSFRVSVCLRRYFSDVRARAFVLVRPARRVRWLQRRLRRQFALRGAFCLRVGGHLLPRAEPLRLLRAGELVEVIPLPEPQAENLTSQVADAPIQAEESRPEEKTITSTSFSADVALHRGSLPDRDDLNTETKPQDTEDNTHAAPDAVDADVNTGGEGALLGVKRRALALLDALDEGPPPPRRVRRRVRRRARRATTPAPDAPSASPGASPRASPPASPGASPAASPAAPQDVARNEDACARKPRMVHSLDVDDI